MTAQLKRMDAIEVLLCDADGNLFPSEEPAFDASAKVTNQLMQTLGSERRFRAQELRLATAGQNFRTTATDLAAAEGHTLTDDQLERWVLEEKRQVSAHLGRVLRPDPEVVRPLARLKPEHALATVSSSASSRVDVCLEATGLAGLFPPDRRYSAEDSLPVPTSKPDPAVYLHAAQSLQVGRYRALAIEDSVPGAQSAVAAGLPTLGNVMFVALSERPARTAALTRVGVAGVISSWRELEELLATRRAGGLACASAHQRCEHSRHASDVAQLPAAASQSPSTLGHPFGGAVARRGHPAGDRLGAARAEDPVGNQPRAP